MSSLEQIQAKALSFADRREWLRYYTPRGVVLGLLVELGELAEHVQYLDGQELQDYVQAHRQEIGDELADVLYWVLVTADTMGVDLEESFHHKMAKNALKYPEPTSGKRVGKLVTKLEREAMAKS